MKNPLSTTVVPCIRQHMPKFAVCATIALAIAFLVPSTAYAFNWGDPVGELTNMINELLFGWLRDILEGLINQALQMSVDVSVSNILVNDFDKLLSSDLTGQSLYNILKGICSSTIVPVGHSILAFVMLVQVVKISQRIDSTATLPAIKEIVFLGVFFIVFTWLINNSFDLCANVFDEVNNISEAIKNKLGGENSIATVTLPEGSVNFSVIVPLVFVALILFAGSLLASVISYVIGWARALQLYIFAAFSPIPFSLMGFEETRSFGINFCKNFVALCLAGAIMIVLMIAYPVLMAGCAANISTNILNMVNSNFAIGTALIKSIACTFMYCFALMKSGSWARDVLGG